MSFRDFNDEGPGTFAWDYVLGGNTTGLFPEGKYFEVDGDTLLEVDLVHTGGGKYDAVYGDMWTITNISPVKNGVFTFEQDGTRYKATINKRFNKKFGVGDGCCIVNLEEIAK